MPDLTISEDQEVDASVSACLSAILPRLQIQNDGCWQAHGGDMSECGSVTRYQEQQKTYMKLASDPSVTTICETGFYNGESAAIWLCANPDVRLFSFELEYQQPNLQIIKDHFGDRFTYFEGDSRVTLSEFATNSSPPFCDIMVADGGHFEDVPWSDITNFAKLAARDPSRRHLVLWDEVYFYRGGVDCCADVTSTYEKAVSLNMFDSDSSFCRGFPCGQLWSSSKEEHERCLNLPAETYPLTGDRTLNSSYPDGGYCALSFASNYLKAVSGQ